MGQFTRYNLLADFFSIGVARAEKRPDSITLWRCQRFLEILPIFLRLLIFFVKLGRIDTLNYPFIDSGFCVKEMSPKSAIVEREKG